ncbi:MAG: MtaA/CmuA family methyltransferase [Chloroflexota bacterium]|nr:MtaA/CmuA family methyltransferase [Chloroflexota bacterium]
MNAKTRFLNALLHQPVDRPPVAAVVTGITVSMMERAGIYYPDAHSDVNQLAGLAASIWEYCGIEAIKLPFGMTVEVEVLGMEIDYGTLDTLPTDIVPIWNDPDELAIPEDFLDRCRVPIVLEAISQLRNRYDREVAVLSSIVGPFALSAKLFGFPNLFPWIITEPDNVHRVMNQLTGLAIQYANAQLDAGADAILLGEATCSGDLISPDTYRDFILPYHKRLCAGIHGPTIMHICGKSSNHLPYIAETGTTCYSFDEGVDIEMARTHLKGKVAMAGYVPTVEAFVRASQRAWEYTKDHPEEAAEIFAEKAELYGFDVPLSLAEIEGSLTLLHTPNSEGKPIGWSAVEDWTATQQLLEEFASFKPEEDINVFFTNDFISEPPYMPAE